MRLSLLLLSLLAGISQLYSQTLDIFEVEINLRSSLNLEEDLEDYTLLEIKDFASTYKVFRESGRDKIRLKLPIHESATVELELVAHDIYAPDFKVVEKSATGDRVVDIDRPLHFTGKVVGEAQSRVGLTMVEEELMGVIVYEKGHYNLERRRDLRGGDYYILYRQEDYKHPLEFQCDKTILVSGQGSGFKTANLSGSRSSVGPIDIYIECDYQLFLLNGSVAATTTFTTNLFNIVADIYANDAGVTIRISELVVWSSTDPYGAENITVTAQMLDAFKCQINSTTGTYNGRLAHVLSGTSIGGGIAENPGGCPDVGLFDGKLSAATEVSDYNADLSMFTFGVYGVAHEIGHNFSAPHTHDCAWNGNNTPIDCCGNNAGFPACDNCNAGEPSDGGTIMSYCHLRPIEVNLVKGFHPQVASKIQAFASCMTPTLPPSCPSPTANEVLVSNITGNSATITCTEPSASYRFFYDDGNNFFCYNFCEEVSTNTVNIKCLEPGTTYTIFVEVACPDGNYFSSTSCIKKFNTTQTSGSDPDRAALMAIYNATGGSSWNRQTNWGTNTDFCTWEGVECDCMPNGNILGLRLPDNNMVGTIPIDIGHLQSLRVVDFGNNQLGGNLSVFTSLVNLRELYLSDNNLSGSMPAQIENLKFLINFLVENNNLTGSLPMEFGNLTRLNWVGLSNNGFSGPFPDIFDNLTDLHDIRISNNNFSGPLPPSLGYRTTLRVVGFEDNNFSGCFPISYKNLCTNRDNVPFPGFGFWNNAQLSNSGNFDLFCDNDVGGCNETISCEWVELEINTGSQSLNLEYLFESTTGLTPNISGGYFFGSDAPNRTLVYRFKLGADNFRFIIRNLEGNGIGSFEVRNLTTGAVLVSNQGFTYEFISNDLSICGGPSCDSQLTINTDFTGTTELFYAEQITANNTISNGANVTYKASATITLQPNFYVQAGAEFLATIEDCPLPIQTISVPELEQVQAIYKIVNQNISLYPNPLTTQTTIKYSLEEEEVVYLQVIDLLGKQVRVLTNGQLQLAGTHLVTFDRQKLKGGTYIVVLRRGDTFESKKLILLD